MGTDPAASPSILLTRLPVNSTVSVLVPASPTTVISPDPTTLMMPASVGPTAPPELPSRNFTLPTPPPPPAPYDPAELMIFLLNVWPCPPEPWGRLGA